jgi:hypothetical protein
MCYADRDPTHQGDKQDKTYHDCAVAVYDINFFLAEELE